ncbi:MAG: hypothetical protein HEQ22_04360 [Sphingopyxis sp.]|uniref:hypothetical protein n=1 Tax=Sphingopyxis sp. TaxID=1908224 RepID=UPI003D811E02
MADRRRADPTHEEKTMNDPRQLRTVPTEQTRNPNISTENQPKGAARRPSDTLDRTRDPFPDREGCGWVGADPDGDQSVAGEGEARADGEAVSGR